MIEYLNDDFIATNLADFGRVNGGAHILEADEIAVRLLQEFYSIDNKAFAPENLKPLSFRDGLMHITKAKLEAEEARTPEQDEYLALINEAIEVEVELLQDEELVVVAPDQHHWKFTRPGGVENLDVPYTFDVGTTPLINAWPELRYSGILANPADPTKPEFDAAFVQHAPLAVARASNIALLTNSTASRQLKSNFVNAVQNMSRRIELGTPEGQYAPSHWVADAKCTKDALTMAP